MKTVGELIAELQKQNPDAQIEMCVGGADCDVKSAGYVVGSGEPGYVCIEPGEAHTTCGDAPMFEVVGGNAEGYKAAGFTPPSAFVHRRPDSDPESDTSVTEYQAVLILQRFVTLAARTALGDGLPAEAIAMVLRDEANAIDGTADVAEDQSPIKIYTA